MYNQGKLCKEASYKLALKTEQEKNKALSFIKNQLLEDIDIILKANQTDIEKAKINGRTPSFIDRLSLNKERIYSIADSIEEVIQLKDPCHSILEEYEYNNLSFIKKSVPIGVIGIIYEARPNVTVDASVLCLKSGNVCFLRGSKETLETNKVLLSSMRKALKQADFDENCIALLEDCSREKALEFMHMNEYLDLLIPRGGANLIKTCVNNASVPIIETGSGNCFIYIDKSADLSQVIPVIINAKCQRVSVCNACESLLIHKDLLSFAPEIIKALKDYQVIIHADSQLCKLDSTLISANEEDYSKEYLDYEISIKTVDNVEEAITHINTHHTMHSDAILAEDQDVINAFINQVDSAVVYVNASTRFSDGNEFGLGAEIGISTQKIHARGPMGLKALTTYKYLVRGNYSIRE